VTHALEGAPKTALGVFGAGEAAAGGPGPKCLDTETFIN
jgi:hypothetical protein